MRRRKYLGFWQKPQSLVETERFVERCLTQDAAHGVELAICLKDDPEERYIGACGLSIDARNRWASLGIVIGRKDLHGQGLGRDAILTLLDYAFGFLNLNKVSLDHAEFNERGARCYRACGFREEGRVRQRWFRDGATGTWSTWASPGTSSRPRDREMLQACLPNPEGYPTPEAAAAEVAELLGRAACLLLALAGEAPTEPPGTDGSLVGIIGALPQYRGKTWELPPLAVRADYRRQGIGRQLVAELERAAAWAPTTPRAGRA